MVRKSVFQKSSRRAVKSTITRFISIVLISFLGAGVFAGLAAVSPNMKRVGNEYYDRYNVMDVRMLSTYGFTDEDVNAIRNTEGVSGIMASYTVDAMGSVGDKDYAFRINGLSATADVSAPDYINQLKMIDGRRPENDGEALIIRPSIGLKNIALQSAVLLDKGSNDALPDTLNRLTYTIVGVAESPYYLSFIQGNTSVGGGMIDYVLYVPQTNFTVDGYTDIYVTVEGAKAMAAFEKAYFDHTDVAVERLEALADERQPLRHDAFQSDLAEAKQEYNDADQEANEKLADARAELEEGEQELTDAKKEYAKGLAKYDEQKADAEQKLADARAQLADAERKLADARKQYGDGVAQYNSQKADAEQKLAESKVQLDAAAAQIAADLAVAKIDLSKNKALLDAAQAGYDAGAPAPGVTKEWLEQNWAVYEAAAAQIAEVEAQLAAAKQILDAGEMEYSEKNAELESARAQIAAAESELASPTQAFRAGLAEYNTKKAEAEKKFAAAKAEFDGAAKKISDGEKELSDGWQEYYNKKTEADTKLADARGELAGAAVEIADGEKELADGWREYEDKKLEASMELADAKKKIEDAEKKLSDLGEPKWYVLDRHMNEAFVTYEDDTERMRDLATIFPIVFYLVAALVCLTTMTRMVDEDRTLIGTFKALGYSNRKIAGRYLGYAASASLIGSAMGIAMGFYLIPTLVWNAYGIVFALPEMAPAFYLGIGFMSVFTTVFVTTLFTGIAAKNSLRESPADLMRPKAPKSGKRVFLEYVKPIWSRLTFTQKVTVRNLGLNKKRLLMSLVGILGCTALVVTAMGAKNAVRTILGGQFGDVFHYNVTVSFDDEIPSPDLTAAFADRTYFEKSTEVFRGSAEAGLEGNDKDTFNIYVVSPKEAEGFSDYVTFYDPETKEEFAFTDDSAVITEKLSMNLNVGIGDMIWVKYLDKEEKHPVKIMGITDNYVFNYIYLGRSAYQAAFNGAPEYNQFFVIMAEGHSKDEVKTYLSGAPGVGAISFTDDLMGNIKNSINSVNNIIWILIIAAGLLAFVVLYNLTNINIGERQRELATLKVLGFYDKETYNYIFRETVILSIVGCIAGLFVGIFLYRAVVTTVEPDMLLLTRDLTWQGYFGAAILTMFFTWTVNWCMKPRIKSIDMLESLKSVD